MKLKFVDANVFIRLITKDDEKKAEKCYLLLKKAEDKKILLTTSESVLSEVVYILISKKLYGLSAKKTRDLLNPIINNRGLKIDFRKEFLRALDIFSDFNVDFEDALTVAYMKNRGIKKIYSYDRDFDKFDFVKRLKP